MTDFGISEMQEMQRALQDQYKDKWEPIGPEVILGLGQTGTCLLYTSDDADDQ